MGVITVFWAVWHARNLVVFEDIDIPISVSLRLVLMVVKEVDVFRLGCCSRSQAELFILVHFAIELIVPKPISYVVVSWQVPHLGSVKVSTDGSSIGSPGLRGRGGGFRNLKGFVHGCFALPMGHNYFFDAGL